MGTSVPMELMLFNKVRTVDGVIIILDLLGRKQVYLRELWTNTGHETFSNRLSRLRWRHPSLDNLFEKGVSQEGSLSQGH